MSEPLEPLSPDAKRVLDLAGPLEPPEGLEQRVFAKLGAAVSGGAAAGAVATGLTTGKLIVMGGALLTVGLGGGVQLGRTVFAPRPPAPVVIERVVRVEVPTAPTPTPEPSPPPEPVAPVVAPRPPLTVPAKTPPPHAPAPPPAALPDEALRQEREWVDTARSALLHGDPTAAIAALEAHSAAFPNGRLSEERESLWVQALVVRGALSAAQEKATAFHRRFPKSLLGPTVDAAVAAP